MQCVASQWMHHRKVLRQFIASIWKCIQLWGQVATFRFEWSVFVLLLNNFHTLAIRKIMCVANAIKPLIATISKRRANIVDYDCAWEIEEKYHRQLKLNGDIKKKMKSKQQTGMSRRAIKMPPNENKTENKPPSRHFLRLFCLHLCNYFI